eukprot:g10578.t1
MAFADQRKRKAAPSMQVEVLCHVLGIWLEVLIVLLSLLQVLGAAAYGGKKKSKFLEAYPMVFKFLLFWWCVFVFAVMTVYIIDHLMYKRFGPAKVVWKAEHIFKGASREELWTYLANPSKWSESDHPVLQTADVSMAGRVFCVRECSQIEDPSDGPFVLIMRTVEGGLGYPFLENTEISEVEMFPSEAAQL